MKERVYLWDNIKVFLMVLVVLTHSVCIYQAQGGVIEYYWVFIMTYTMPLFTMVSGYWYKEKNMRQIIHRFLWPCILFSIINFSWGSLFYESYKEAGIGIYLRFGYAMWYLWALFVYYLITPILLRYFSLSILLGLSFCVALLAGFFPFIGGILQLSRVICFYPFFLLGLLLNKNNCWNFQWGRGLKWWYILLFFSLVYILVESLYPGAVYYTGFTGGYGEYWMNGLIWRIFTYAMCICMSVCVIMAMPDKKLWFTKYGSRTMNVYLLHMLIVFPCTWYIGMFIKDTWYGCFFLTIVVPLFCMFFFSEKVDRVMRKILFLS